jgi:hypothetical protein
MLKDTWELYKLAKIINYEVFLDGQVQSAGSRQSTFLETLEKRKSYIKRSVIAMKIIYAGVFSFLPIFPLMVYFGMKDTLASSGIGQPSIDSIIFTGSVFFSIYFVMIFLYLLLLGILNVSSYMSGNSFQWLQTLPLSKEELQRLGFMTVFRSLDLPLIAVVFSFPLIMGIATQSVLLVIISLITSIPNVFFIFSLLIFLSEKMGRILYSKTGMTKKKSIIRTLTMLGYFIMAFTMGFVIQLAFNSLDFLFDQFQNLDNPTMLNYIFSLIPYPFAPSYLISIIASKQVIPIGLFITSLIGFTIFIMITVGIYKIAVKSLKSVVAFEEDTSSIKEEDIIRREDIEVKIETKKPIKSFIRKDLATAARDIQTFMFILMPIILPFITIMSTLSGINLQNIQLFDIGIIWMFMILSCAYIPLMIISGLLNMEESGATVLASLPIIPREQAKAKLYLMFIILTLSFIIAPLIVTIIALDLRILLFIIASIPFGWTFLLLGFVLKVRLFGKMKYKYVLEEVNPEKKILKWALIFGTSLGLFALLFFSVIGMLMLLGDLILTAVVILGAGVIGTLILWYTFNRMFPKPEKMREYKTGGALRETPVLGVIVVLVLYAIFLFLPEFAELLVLIPFINKLSYVAILFIDFAFVFGFLALLLFYIVPKGLNLPFKDQKFAEYFDNIGLKKGRYFFKNILIGLTSFAIFAGVVLLGGVLLGNYEFEPDILFSNPTIFNLGWFLFIVMLIPGIWEEVAFRGVIIPNLKRKYSQRSILIISAVAFGLAHSLNFILVIFGGSPLNTILQLIYATCLGFAFGFMFLKTESLIPCILLHYLVDSVGQLFLYVWFSNDFLLIVYLIVFVGVLPSLLIIIFVHFATKNR